MKYKIFNPESIYSPAEIMEVRGYPVEFDLPYKFFVAKKDSKGLWAVYEETSGGRIGGFKRTKKEAISEVGKMMGVVSSETLKLAVELGLKKRKKFEEGC